MIVAIWQILKKIVVFMLGHFDLWKFTETTHTDDNNFDILQDFEK